MPEDVTIQALVEQNRRTAHSYLKNRLDGATVPEFEEFNEMIDKGYVKPETIHNLYVKDGYDMPDLDQFKKNIGIGYANNEPQGTPVIVKQPYEGKPERQKTEYDHYLEKQKSIDSDINKMSIETANQVRDINTERVAGIVDEIKNKYTAVAEMERNSPRWEDPLFRANFDTRINNQAREEFDEKIGKLTDETEKFYEDAIQNITDMAYMPTVLQPDMLDEKKNTMFSSDWFIGLSSESKNNVLKANWLLFAQERLKDGTLTPNNFYQAKKEYMHYMLKPLFDKGGNKADTYALKNYLASLQTSIKEEMKESQANFEVNPLTNQLIYKGDPSDYKDEFDKLESLRIASDDITRVLSIPDSDESKLLSFQKGLSSMKYYDYLPFIAGTMDIVDNVKVLQIAKKAERGDKLSDEEAQLFGVLGAITELKASTPKNTMYQVGETVGQAIPYVGEFALTSGAFTAGRTATKKAIQSMVVKSIEKKVGEAVGTKALRGAITATTKGVSGTAAKSLTYAVGALSQTAVNPQSYISNTLERMTPQVGFMMTDGGTPVMSVIDFNSSEPFGEAFSKGFGMSYAEFFTEKLGEHAFPYVSKQFNKITNDAVPKGLAYFGKRNQEWIKRTMVGNYLRAKGIDVKIPGLALKEAAEKRLGWSGLFSEYGEEFVNTRMSDFLTGDYEGGRIASLYQFDWEQEKLTALSVLAMSAAFGAPGQLQKGVHYAKHGNTTTFKYHDTDGNERKVDVPNTVLNKLRFEFENEIPDVNKITKIIEGENLQEDQKAIVTAMVSEEMTKKVKQAVDKGITPDTKRPEPSKKQKAPAEEAPTLLQDVVTEKKPQPKQPSKQREVSDINKDIVSTEQKINELMVKSEHGEPVEQSEIEDLEARKQRLQEELKSATPKVKKAEKKEGEGEIIYGTPTIGKTSLIEKMGDENVVDSDKILYNMLKEEGLEYESPDFFDQEYGLIGFRHPELEKKFQRKILDLKKQGKTIIGGNNWLRPISDKAVVSEDVEMLAERIAKRDKLPMDKALARARRIIAKEGTELKNIPIRKLAKGEALTPEMIIGKPISEAKPVEIKEVKPKEEAKPKEAATKLEIDNVKDVYKKGYSEEIDNSIDKLLNKKELTPGDKDSLNKWVSEATKNMTKLQAEKGDDITLGALNNLELINLLLNKDDAEIKKLVGVFSAEKVIEDAKKQINKIREFAKEPAVKGESGTKAEEKKLKEDLSGKDEKQIKKETKKVSDKFDDKEQPVMKLPKTLLRHGAIKGDAAYFAISKENAIVENMEGVEGYVYDEDIKIADVSDKKTIEILKTAALEDAKTPKEKEFIKKWKWDDSHSFEDNKPIMDAARKLGYDGLSQYDISDYDKPSAVNIWNLNKIKPATVSAEGKSMEQYFQDVVDNSYDPEQLYEVYNQLQSDFEKLASWEQRLTEYKFSQESFVRFNDKNNVTKQMQLNWFTPNKGNDIDTAAQELSEDYFMDITPDMVTEFIVSHPGKISRVSKEKGIIAKRYKEITNKPIEESRYLIKYMLGNGNATELLLTEDPELSDHIFTHLRNNYPSIEVFKDKKSFEDFVRKLGDKEYEVSPDVIGAALKLAVYIDASKAKQSTPIHEYAHIYWDMLDPNDPAKKKLMELYKGENLNEEDIIGDIGRAGVDIMKIKLRKGKINRFVDALRNFWRSVKKKLGMYAKKDFVYDMAKSVLKNQNNLVNENSFGAREIKNMVENDSSAYEKDASFDKVGGKSKLNITGVLKMLQGKSFDPEVELEKAVNKLRDRLISSGKSEDLDMTKTLEEEQHRLKNMWEKSKDIGTAIDDIMSTIFGGNEITDEMLGYSKQLMGNKTTENVIESAKEIYSNLQEKHPKSKFYVQQSHFSEAHDITYRPDIYIVDPSNKIFVYDIKSSNEELIDEEGNVTNKYRRVQGEMEYPLRGKYQSYETSFEIQTAAYAKLLLDEFTEQNPGKKYNIGGLGIIPVQTVYNEKGELEKVNISRNLIDLNYANKRITMLRNVASILGFIDTINKELPELDKIEEELIKQNKWDQITISKVVKAIKGFTFGTGKNLKDIKSDDIELMRGTGVSKILNNLSILGYTEEDLKDMSFERMFYASEKGLTKKNLNMSFRNVIVDTNYNIIPKEGSKSSLYSIDLKGEKLFLSPMPEKSGTRASDDVVMILTVKTGKDIVNSYEKGKIIGYNDTDNYFLVKLDSSTIKRSYKDRNDLYVNVSDVISDKIKSRKGIVPLKKSFDVEPEYKIENHYRTDDSKSKFKPEEYYRYISGMKLLWNFFNKYPTLNNVRKASMDKEEMINQYSTISTIVNNELSDYLSSYIRDVLTNHTFAEGISHEANYQLDQMRPWTLEAYDMITGDEQMLYKDHKGIGLSGLTAPFMLSDRFIPLRMVTGLVSGSHMEYQKEMYDFHNVLKESKHIIDKSNLAISENGRTYYKHPSNFEEGTPERQLLDKIYELNKKLFPGFDQGQEMVRIPEAYMNYSEFKTQVTGMRSKYIYEMLKPDSELDYIKLDYTNKDGVKVLTLREIKDQYLLDKDMSDSERERIFGSAIHHPLTRMPGLRRKNWKNGELGEYINKARKILVEGKDKNNPNLSKNIKSLRISSWGSVKLKTDDIINATEKYFRSQLYKYHMRESVPFYDYVRSKYDGSMNAYKWLEKYVNGVVYKQGSAGGTSKELEYLAHQASGLFSMAKIGFAIKTQVYNYSIGKLNNLTLHPEAFFRGQIRTNPLTNMKGLRKSFTLMRMLGHIDIVDETFFDSTEKSVMENAAKYMFMPMEWTERLIQKDIIAGLLTEKEWNSFDEKGNITDPQNFPTESRRQSIVDTALNIHGAYSKVASPPWAFDPLGRQVLMFKKWIPSIVHRWFAGYYRDRDQVWKSGILPSLVTYGKLLKYKLSPDNENKRAKLQKAIEALPGLNKDGITSVKDYVSMIISGAKDGKITLQEDLSKSDKTNLKSVVIYAGISAMLYMMMEGLTGGEDDDKRNITVKNKYIFTPYLKKILSEYSFWTNMDNYEDIGAAALRMLPEFINAFIALGQVTEQDNAYTEKGAWAFPQKSLGLIPGGQFAKNTWKNIVFTRKWISGELERDLNSQKYDDFFKAMKNNAEYPDDEKVIEIQKQLQLSVDKLVRENEKERKALIYKTDIEPALEDDRVLREEYEKGMEKQKVINKTTKQAPRLNTSKEFENIQKELAKELEKGR